MEIEFGVTKLPQFDVPEGYTSWEYLNKLCMRDWITSVIRTDDEACCRSGWTMSCTIIQKMGYVRLLPDRVGFYPFCQESHGITVGPGRGSAAGSIVSYCLEITDIDPIRYQLLFERFLNPERVSMPDIDIDFCFETTAGGH